jgi:quinone-modifying oxidoreductase subunit QmoB
MEKKYGVYVCKGCGIGGAVDIEKVISTASSTAKVPKDKFKSHEILCGPDGLQMIKNDIQTDGVNAITLVACSQRVKTAEFDFPGTIVTRANIRELVAWSQPPQNEATQALAADYAVMGIIKTQKGDLPEPNILADLNRNVMVVGAGVGRPRSRRSRL